MVMVTLTDYIRESETKHIIIVREAPHSLLTAVTPSGPAAQLPGIDILQCSGLKLTLTRPGPDCLTPALAADWAPSSSGSGHHNVASCH